MLVEENEVAWVPELGNLGQPIAAVFDPQRDVHQHDGPVAQDRANEDAGIAALKQDICRQPTHDGKSSGYLHPGRGL